MAMNEKREDEEALFWDTVARALQMVVNVAKRNAERKRQQFEEAKKSANTLPQ